MDLSSEWLNPITVPSGQVQHGVDPLRLRPSRGDLIQSRLEFQRSLIRAGKPRLTLVQVSREGVIVDGHHATRAAVEEGQAIDVLVTALSVSVKANSIMDLNVR